MQGIIICNNRLIHADIIKLYVYNNILWFYYRLLKIQTILLNGEQIWHHQGSQHNYGENTYYIFADGIILCQCSTFTKALCLWFSIHYIFNLEYSKPLKDVSFCCIQTSPENKKATYLTTSSDIVSTWFSYADPPCNVFSLIDVWCIV